MLFNSLEYIYLLTASLALYWVSPSLRLRQTIVFCSSIYFYMSWSKIFVLLLLGMILLNWLIAGFMAKSRSKNWILFSTIINLSVLAYFKYANFFLDNVNVLAHAQGLDFNFHLSVILPLGISFYIFELISYQIDIYRKKIEHDKDILSFSIFVLFFPHLIAGPICRAGQLVPQIKTMQVFSPEKIYKGFYFFLSGFALKCGVADGLSPYVNVIFHSPDAYSGFDNLMAIVGFGIQILCDFWGYSLMALGAAFGFGYILPANFDAPYIATSIRDFWRRWHITLSNWLRDYLYISMGGARVSPQWKIQRNLIVTMLLGGLWHGASWNFIIWGGIHGVALAVNRYFGQLDSNIYMVAIFKNKLIAWALTMVVVFVAWVFFRAVDFNTAMLMFRSIFQYSPGWLETKLSPSFFELLLFYVLLQYLVHTTTVGFENYIKRPFTLSLIVASLVLYSLVYYVDGNDFIYFHF